jgi:hypothetical protein
MMFASRPEASLRRIRLSLILDCSMIAQRKVGSTEAECISWIEHAISDDGPAKN